MAYHITVIANNSGKSIALTNPAYEKDSMLIPANGQPYKPERPVLVNKMDGNPSYQQAVSAALNLYTFKDNYCFWDNTNSAVNGVGETTGAIGAYNAKAGDLTITVNSDGSLSFARVDTAAVTSA
jgi:hypothetical protein